MLLKNARDKHSSTPLSGFALLSRHAYTLCRATFSLDGRVRDSPISIMHPEDDKRETIEDVGGEFGFRLRWRVSDSWANVEVWEAAAVSDRKEFQLIDAPLGEFTPDIERAEKYLHGFIKWDGCAELNQGCPHWCGAHHFKKHIGLLVHIYTRAPELMGRGFDGLDEPWFDEKEKPNA